MESKGRSRVNTWRRGSARLLAGTALVAVALLAAASTAFATPIVSYDHEWHNAPVTVDFASTLGTVTQWMIQVPAVEATWYDVGPTDAWTFSPGDPGLDPGHNFWDGMYRVNYQGRDASNVQVESGYFILKIDTLAPYTRVSGLSSAWKKPPVSLVLNSCDEGAGVGITWWVLNDPVGGMWQALGNDKVVTVSTNGANTLYYQAFDNSVDADGYSNQEIARTATVRVDNTRPVPAAYANVSVRYGSTASLRYKAGEPITPTAAVKIVIKRGTAVVRTISLGQQARNTWRYASTRANLARGIYTWYVYATDLAGNTQSVVPHRTLRIY